MSRKNGLKRRIWKDPEAQRRENIRALKAAVKVSPNRSRQSNVTAHITRCVDLDEMGREISCACYAIDFIRNGETIGHLMLESLEELGVVSATLRRAWARALMSGEGKPFEEE